MEGRRTANPQPLEPGPSFGHGIAYMVLLNCIRVVVGAAWTAVVATPLLVVIYSRYLYGMMWAKLGRSDVLDRVLDANAKLAGWVAHRLWMTVLLSIAGVRLRVRELNSVDWMRTHVICANHASILDIFALACVVEPPFRFVAKRELVKWPIVGWGLRAAGQIIVDRRDHARALRSIAEAAVRKIQGQVIFFVEGTRSRSGELQPFKKGAFHFAIDNELPVLPTAIRGSYAALARLPWWKLKPGREIEILFCPQIEPAAVALGGETAAAVEALCAETRAEIAHALER